VYFAPLEKLVEAQPSQFVGRLLWARLHSRLLWAQGAGEEAEREDGMLLADFHPPLISTLHAHDLKRTLSPAQT